MLYSYQSFKNYLFICQTQVLRLKLSLGEIKHQLFLSKNLSLMMAWHDVTFVNSVADVKVEPGLLAAWETQPILQRCGLVPQQYSSGLK